MSMNRQSSGHEIAAVRETVPARIRKWRLFLKFVLLLSLCIEIVFWAAFFRSSLHTQADFRQLYAAGYMARSGHLNRLYDLELQHDLQNSLVSYSPRVLPYIRPAYSTLLFAPLTFLSYRSAYFVWLLFNMLLLGASFRLLTPLVEAPAGAWTAAAFVVFVPVQIALMQGQDSILLLLLISFAFVLLNQGREFASGLICGLGLFKFQLIFPIALLFILKRRWNFVTGLTLVAMLLAGLSSWIVGVDQTRLYFQLLRTIGMESSNHHPENFVSWTSMATLKGLVIGLGHSHLSQHAIQLSSIVVSAALVLTVALGIPRVASSTELLLVSIVAAVLAGGYVFAHDLSILLLPISLGLRNLIQKGDFGWFEYGATAVFTVMLLEFYFPSHFYLVSLFILWFLGTTIQSIRKRQLVKVSFVVNDGGSSQAPSKPDS